MGQAEGERRPRHALGLGGGFRPQAVIDGGDVEGGCAARQRGGVHQGRRIRAAGDRQQDGAAAREIGREGTDDRGAGILRGILARPAQAAQRARFCSRATPWRTLGVALGNLRSSSARVAQACSRAPRALREAPSFSIASGACGERA
ncbi:hypothetical protein AEGHOMDF_5783 [Methylobacterium soli]|nr:hypothetical protein AEGHOMDF_5783 [Methylobacterium soli]